MKSSMATGGRDARPCREATTDLQEYVEDPSGRSREPAGVATKEEERGMREHTEAGSDQADGKDTDKASSQHDAPKVTDRDRGANLRRTEGQGERQAEQDSALQRWETEGGAASRQRTEREGKLSVWAR